jgi:hypothetical protein
MVSKAARAGTPGTKRTRRQHLGLLPVGYHFRPLATGYCYWLAVSHNGRVCCQHDQVAGHEDPASRVGSFGAG